MFILSNEKQPLYAYPTKAEEETVSKSAPKL